MRKGRKSTQLSAEQENAIIKDYKADIPVRDIFKKHAIPMNRLYDLIKKYNIPKRGGLDLPVIGTDEAGSIDLTSVYQTQDVAIELDLTKSQIKQISYLLNSKGYPIKKAKRGNMEIRVYDEEAIGLMTQVAYEIQEKKKSVEKAVNIVLGNNPHLITQPEEEKEEMDAPVRAVPEVHDEVILLIIQKVLDRYNRGEISPATALLKVKVATELLD